MILRCPNISCNTKMSIKEEVAYNYDAKTKCPSCKEIFKPFDCLPESQQNKIMNQIDCIIESQQNKTMNQSKANDKICSDSEETKFKATNNGKVALGWLVVHDEKTHSQTYDLYEGMQLIGRKSESRPCDVMIETNDRCMSRNHFTIEVTTKYGENQYVLKNAKSTNGTFVETKMLRGYVKELRPMQLGEEVYIEDGDIIQAGNTKIILKTPKTATNRESATQIVKQTEIAKTIIV